MPIKTTLISFYLAFLILLSFHSKAQNTNPSYLESILPSNPDSIAQVARQAAKTTKNKDSVNYYQYINIKSTFYTGKLSSTLTKIDSLLAEEITNKLRIKLLNNRASYFSYINEPSKSIEAFKELIPLCKKTNDDLTYRAVTGNLAAVYTKVRNIDSALFYAQLALEADLAANDSAGIAFDYNIIASCYKALSLYQQAADNFVKGIAYKPGLLTTADLYYNLSNCYLELHQYDKIYEPLNTASTYYLKLNHIKGYMNSLSALAVYYNAIRNFEKSKETNLELIELAKEQADSTILAICYSNLSSVEFKLNNFNESLRLAKDAEKINKKIGRTDFSKNTVKNIAFAFAALHQADSAIHYSGINDTLVSHLNSKQYLDELSKLEAELNVAEKERALAEQALEIQQKEITLQKYRLRIYIIIAAILILIVLGVILFTLYKQKQKQKHQEALLAEKQESINREIEATENERNRISKELHDGIGQELSAINMNLSHIISRKDEIDLEKELSTINKLVKQSALEVRNISHQMMPRALVEDGLIEALKQMLHISLHNSNIAYNYEYNNEANDIPKNIQISLYRIAQELVNNIIKHSQAKNVEIQLYKTKSNYLLHIEDDGKGQLNNNKMGHGIQNIKNRVDMFKGQLNIEQQKGVSVNISIPI